MNEFKEKAGRLLYSAGLKIKKDSPEILLVCGIVGTIATTVIACKETLKINDILDEREDTINKIDEALKMNNKEYTEEDSKKDLYLVNVQTGAKIVRLYAPAIGLGILSIGAIVSGHTILNKRNAAIAAAYTILDKSFKNYRKNVINKFGKEIDSEMRLKLNTTTVEEKDAKGKTKTSELKVVDDNYKEFSDYARFFDASCQGHTKDPEYNLMYLKHQQAYCNEMLKSRGHLFLNEVYDVLDIPRTKAGQVVGWKYYPNGDNPNGDNYVDFGIYDADYEPSRRFVNGNGEYNILLDFNVDGVIYDAI